jgi:hypothetical protein
MGKRKEKEWGKKSPALTARFCEQFVGDVDVVWDDWAVWMQGLGLHNREGTPLTEPWRLSVVNTQQGLVF